MCGICGCAGLPVTDSQLARMTDTMVHRGPDDSGCYTTVKLGMGMRRLSIIDVEGGEQPITNEDGTVVVVLNGEIYNYRALRRELEQQGHRFSTRSDTETIVHLYEEHGIDCLQHLRGMFAFALYDTNRDQMFVARDRLGIKPLYYWNQNGALIFASEIKSILAHQEVSREPYLPAIDSYLSLRYVPGECTLFSHIYKLPAGHYIRYEKNHFGMQRYWDVTFSNGPYAKDGDYRERFSELFRETVKLHLESDVPVGAYLSGGIDSSALVAMMSETADRPVETFSVGFDWPGDELPVARQTAERLGCNHHEIICRPDDIELLPRIVWHLDEPIGDAIVLPMYLLSRLAGQHVKVVLSGEGADEVMAGYLFHKVMVWADRYVRWTPGFLHRHVVKPLVSRMPASLLNCAFSYPAALGDRGRLKVLDYLESVPRRNPEDQYRFLISLFDDRDKQGLYKPGGKMLDLPAFVGPPRHERVYLNSILALQYNDWLPDDILMKADKTSMANSVEGRVPFMDHVLVEFLNQVPSHLKLRGLGDKVMLREFLQKMLPGKLARQSKKAFYVPLERYFATPAFQELVNICLSEESVRRRGYYNWKAVRLLRDSLGNQEFLYAKQVLSLVMLELWHRIFIDQESGWVS